MKFIVLLLLLAPLAQARQKKAKEQPWYQKMEIGPAWMDTFSDYHQGRKRVGAIKGNSLDLGDNWRALFDTETLRLVTVYRGGIEWSGTPWTGNGAPEWEHAARAGTKTRWHSGDDVAKLAEYCTYQVNSVEESQPVGSRKPNQFGVYDMLGSMWEHVSDIYDPNYYAEGPKVDPTGPGNESKSRIQYTVQVPKAGRYALSAKVVAVNYGESIDVAVNDTPAASLECPYAMTGEWQHTEPVVVDLKQGDNVLKFCRTNPPQHGVALKFFALKPIP